MIYLDVGAFVAGSWAYLPVFLALLLLAALDGEWRKIPEAASSKRFAAWSRNLLALGIGSTLEYGVSHNTLGDRLTDYTIKEGKAPLFLRRLGFTDAIIIIGAYIVLCLGYYMVMAGAGDSRRWPSRVALFLAGIATSITLVVRYIYTRPTVGGAEGFGVFVGSIAVGIGLTILAHLLDWGLGKLRLGPSQVPPAPEKDSA